MAVWHLSVHGELSFCSVRISLSTKIKWPWFRKGQPFVKNQIQHGKQFAPPLHNAQLLLKIIANLALVLFILVHTQFLNIRGLLSIRADGVFHMMFFHKENLGCCWLCSAMLLCDLWVEVQQVQHHPGVSAYDHLTFFPWRSCRWLSSGLHERAPAAIRRVTPWVSGTELVKRSAGGRTGAPWWPQDNIPGEPGLCASVTLLPAVWLPVFRSGGELHEVKQP